MFVIFCLYVFVYLSFRFIVKRHFIFSLVLFTGLSIGLMIILYFAKNPTWWNTIPCFVLGIWYGFLKDKIDLIIAKPKIYWPITSLTLLVFFGNWMLWVKFSNNFQFVLLALLFAFSIVFISMKIKIHNALIYFLGIHTFSIYILQRIPMIIFKGLISNTYLFLAICFVTTVLFGFLFDKLFCNIKKIVFSKESR